MGFPTIYVKNIFLEGRKIAYFANISLLIKCEYFRNSIYTIFGFSSHQFLKQDRTGWKIGQN